MKRIGRLLAAVVIARLLTAMACAAPIAAERPIVPDLKALAAGAGSELSDGGRAQWLPSVKGKAALQLTGGKDGALLLLKGIDFADGVIEFDTLGQSAPPQGSFVGIVFRVDGHTGVDSVYFRPFNFRADTALARSHSLQYMSLPDNPWKVLRERKPGGYEREIMPAPDGDAWVHARIVFRKPSISVYVDGATTPSLVVDELTGRKGGGIGLFVGSEQGGYFANLTITPAPRANP